MTSICKKFASLNWLLIASMIMLVGWGIWSVYNASSFREGGLGVNKWRDQMQWAWIGLAVFFAVSMLDYKWVRFGAPVLNGIALAWVLKILLVPPKMGSRGVHEFPILDVDPRPLLIAGSVLILAVILANSGKRVLLSSQWLWVTIAAVVAGASVKTFLETSDLGFALLLIPIVIALLLSSSVPSRYLFTLFLVVLCLLPLWYFFGLKPYQKNRVEVFINMLTNKKVDKLGDAYMADKIQIAVGSAGLEGKGPLLSKVPDRRSVHRTFFSETESINDFIFAVIVEEFGVIGGMAHIVVTVVLLVQCLFVACRARDALGRLLAAGVGAMLFAYTWQHMAVNLLMMPITGVPLPFISYGGPFLVVCLFHMGLVQSVWVHRHLPHPTTEEESAEEEGAVIEVEGSALPSSQA